MTAFLEALLGVLAVGFGWAIVGVPLSSLAIASGRKAPERIKLRAVPWAIAIAAWTGLILGLVGLLWGTGIGDENAGEGAELLALIGCCPGVPMGFLGSWFVITRRVKGPAPIPTELERPALRAQRGAMVLLGIGTFTTLTGMVGSISMGLLSLAIAQAVVRPLAIIFVVLHGVAAVLAGRLMLAAQSDQAKSRGRSALIINVCGLLVAALIAAAGPGFYESVTSSVMKGLVR